MTDTEKPNGGGSTSPVSTATSSSTSAGGAKATSYILPKVSSPTAGSAAAVSTSASQSPPLTSINVEVEKKKNELVQAMLAQIRRFVTNQGGLLPDADISAYAALMREETTVTADPAVLFMKKTLLLTVLLNANNGVPFNVINSADLHVGSGVTGYKLLCENAEFMGLLNDWLQDAAKKGSPLLLKLLDLFGVLPLSLEHLVQHKTGRLIKKLARGEEPKQATLNAAQMQEIKGKADRIFEKWSNMALQHDSAQQEQQQQHALEEKRTKRSHSTSSETQPEPEEESSRYAQRITSIVERASSSSAPKDIPTGRPMSADDIHKAKKKKMYLDMLAASSAAPGKDDETGFDENDDYSIVDDSKVETAEMAPAEPEVAQASTEVDNKTQETVDPVAVEKTVEKSAAPVSLSISQFLSAARLQQVQNPPGLPSLPGLTTPQSTTPQSTPARKSSILKSSLSSSSLGRERKRKRVSFPANAFELVQIRIIDSEFEKHGERHHDLHEADRKEATFAFAQLQKTLEPEVPWSRPAAWQLPEDLRPGRVQSTPEMQAQQARTSRALSGGSGPLQYPLSTISDDLVVSGTTSIPLRDAANTPPLVRPVPVNVKKSASTASVASPPMDPKLLSLLQSGDLLKNLLKK